MSMEGKSVSTASNNYRVLCQRGFNFEKSVDTWLTRQGEFGERKIPNSLIFRVRDLELWYSRRDYYYYNRLHLKKILKH